MILSYTAYRSVYWGRAASIQTRRWIYQTTGWTKVNESIPNDDNERLLALLGLALDSQEAAGSPPDLAEVDCWRRGELDEPRATEVRGDLLRSSRCHGMLKQLEREERALEAMQVEMQQERNTALLGLSLDAKVLPGIRPDLAEVDQYRRGELEAARAEEVRAYLLRDASVQEMLKQLEREEREIAEYDAQYQAVPVVAAETRAAVRERASSGTATGLLQKLTRLIMGEGDFGFGGALATGMAMLFVAVLGLQALQDPSLMEQVDEGYLRWSGSAEVDRAHWPWQRPDQTKALGLWEDPVAPAPEKLAFSVGVGAGLEQLTGQYDHWHPLIAQLPDKLPTCSGDDSECLERLEQLHAAGRWSVLLQLQCGQGGSVEASFWKEQFALVELFADRLSSLGRGAAPFAGYFARWPAGTDPQDSLCAGVPGLLDLGLVYLPSGTDK